MKKYVEHKNLEDFDWRCQAVTTLKGDQVVFGNKREDGTPVSLVGQILLNKDSVVFNLPNMTSIFLDFANKLFQSIEGYMVFVNFTKIKKSYIPKDYGGFMNVLECRIGNVIFAYSALECFVNDLIPASYTYKNSKGKICDKRFIEEKFTMADKMEKVLKGILKLEFIDSEILGRYEKIKYMRDRVVHLKEIDKRQSDVSDNTIRKDFLSKDFINYAIEVKKIIGYFLQYQENEPRRFSKMPF